MKEIILSLVGLVSVKDIVLLLVGAFLGFFINLLSTALFPTIHLKYKHWKLHKLSKGREQLIRSSFPVEKLSIGELTVNVIVLVRGHFGLGQIQCSYNPTSIRLLPEFARMKRDYMSDWKKKLEKGATNLPYNGPTYKLLEFNTGYREIIDNEEVPVLRLKCGPTDYFTQIITDLNINHPIREKYAKSTILTEHPVPEFASCIGISLNLITKDGFLIVAERSLQTFVAGGKLQSSVAENFLRPTDGGKDGAPDPFRCALRGVQEELGLQLNYQDIFFTTFILASEYCQYYFIGTIETQYDRAEIEDIRRIAIPKDKWETRRIIFIPCNPKSIAEFALSHWDHWEQIGIASVILSLYDLKYSEKEIHAAFSRSQSKARKK